MISAPSPIRSVSWQQFNAPGTTDITVDYPATVSAGDVLLVEVGGAGTSAITASGWTELDQRSATSLRGAVFWRTAVGTEGGTTFTIGVTDLNRDTTVAVYAIDGGTPEITATSGDSATPDPPSITPSGGSGQYLIMELGVIFHNGSYPSTFSDGFGAWLWPSINLSVGVRFWSASRMVDASTLDPTAMTMTVGNPWIAWTVAIPISVGVANFPVVEATDYSVWPSAATTQTLDLPAGIQSGDLLIAEIGNTGTAAPTITGWTTLLGPTPTSTFETGTVLYRVADGSEGASVTVNFSASALGSGTVRRISGADATKLDGAISGNAASTTVIPPALTPADGADDILWLTGFTGDTTESAPRQWPVNSLVAGIYANTDSGTYSAGTALNAASFTPGSISLHSSRRNVAWTVAVYPGAAAQTIAVGTATERELAGAIIPVKPIMVQVGTAAEAELGQPITPQKAMSVLVGTATELERGLTIVPQLAQTVIVGTAGEVEFVGVIAPSIVVPGRLDPIECAITAPTATCGIATPTSTCSITEPTAQCS